MTSKPSKPRKWAGRSTHAVRQEEKCELLAEIAALEQQLQALNEQAGRIHSSSSPSSPSPQDADNEPLLVCVRRLQQSLAAAQAVVSGLLTSEHSTPLSAPIRLGSDWSARRRELRALRDEKIGNACRFVAARSQFLDPLKPHAADERFENALGDFCCARFEQLQFTGAPSVRFVFDALVAFMHSVEIRVSEQLGAITVRDDLDLIEDCVANYHLLTHEFGVLVETHGALFMQFFESHELAHGGPCGVVAVDCVDDDLLHPYSPDERVRKDVTTMMTLTPHYRPRMDGSGEQELVVRLSASKFVRLHHAICPAATPAAVAQLRANITGWADVLVVSIHDAIRRQGWESECRVQSAPTPAMPR